MSLTASTHGGFSLGGVSNGLTCPLVGRSQVHGCILRHSGGREFAHLLSRSRISSASSIASQRSPHAWDSTTLGCVSGSRRSSAYAPADSQARCRPGLGTTKGQESTQA